MIEKVGIAPLLEPGRVVANVALAGELSWEERGTWLKETDLWDE